MDGMLITIFCVDFLWKYLSNIINKNIVRYCLKIDTVWITFTLCWQIVHNWVVPKRLRLVKKDSLISIGCNEYLVEIQYKCGREKTSEPRIVKFIPGNSILTARISPAWQSGWNQWISMKVLQFVKKVRWNHIFKSLLLAKWEPHGEKVLRNTWTHFGVICVNPSSPVLGMLFFIGISNMKVLQKWKWFVSLKTNVACMILVAFGGFFCIANFLATTRTQLWQCQMQLSFCKKNWQCFWETFFTHPIQIWMQVTQI